MYFSRIGSVPIGFIAKPYNQVLCFVILNCSSGKVVYFIQIFIKDFGAHYFSYIFRVLFVSRPRHTTDYSIPFPF